MLGIVSVYTQADWETDMRLAQAVGIDAFALNIGKDSYNAAQLENAYNAAAATGFKVFISFDFAYWTNGDFGTISSYLQTYATRAGQYKYNNKAFVSTFVGGGFDRRAVESSSGVPIFACPNYQPGALRHSTTAATDCGFSWDAWPSQDNQPINSNKTTTTDINYINSLGGKPYMMPVSPWFYTHYGGDTYNKNWIFYSDYLWTQRWEQVLSVQPQFVEVLTWNDFGESHYIGPLHPEKPEVYAPNGQDNGAKKWVTGMDHTAWQDVMVPYINAFKAGSTTPSVSSDELVYYYRTSPKDASCSDPVPKPTGYQYDGDLIFVTALLTSPGTVIITSGSTSTSINVAAGIHTVSAPMGIGVQSFGLTRNGATVLSGTSPKQVDSSCTGTNPAQPFNAFVGSIKA
ncbi:glycoside hydrolase family 71 protein [Atractiella rhizophila]|nr:glycoside hydrolase family 71 protein [Atractiella rhizophila]